MRLIFCLFALLLAALAFAQAPALAQSDSGGDTVQRFTELAFQYGPFFFAIFFLLIITPQLWALATRPVPYRPM